jgi:glutamate-5-semialdehyde dehydrogenase
MTMSNVNQPLLAYCEQLARTTRDAATQMSMLSGERKNRCLLLAADLLERNQMAILAANQLDLEASPQYGLSPAELDRLRLDPARIADMAAGLRAVAAQRDPIGDVIAGEVRPNGLKVQKVRVPLGVIFFIYESRPNVTADAAALCIKSGNAIILRGGKEGVHSSRAIVKILRQAAEECGVPPEALGQVEVADREAVGYLLQMAQFIDVTIPRGGKSLIERVTAEARMPVIKHYDGNCHVYVDQAADLKMAERIVWNSKCQRMGVCNACESLLVHREVADRFLPMLADRLIPLGIELRGDAEVCRRIKDAKLASEEDWGTEYLGPILSVRVVDGLNEAIEHINRYGSKHTDAIITSDIAAADYFCRAVDSSAVVVNASTRFNDGGQLGLGAEIGISTDKFHARGPCGAMELTSYKYVIVGQGQVRE